MRCGSNLRWTDVGETGMRHGLVPDAQVHAPVPAISRAICLHPPPSWGVGEPKVPFARRGKHGCKPTASRLQAQVVAGSRPIKPLRSAVHVQAPWNPQAKLTSNHTGTQWCSSVGTAPDPCPMHPPARFSGSDLFQSPSRPHVVLDAHSAVAISHQVSVLCSPNPTSVVDGFGLCVQPLVEGREGGREVRGPSSRVDVTSQSTSGRWDKSGLQFAS